MDFASPRPSRDGPDQSLRWPELGSIMLAGQGVRDWNDVVFRDAQGLLADEI